MAGQQNGRPYSSPPVAFADFGTFQQNATLILTQNPKKKNLEKKKLEKKATGGEE